MAAKLLSGNSNRVDRVNVKRNGIYDRYVDYTMVPKQVYIDNLQLAKQVEEDGVSGCIVECGVWRGGMIAGLATLLGNGRSYYLFDSFEGLPKPQPIDGDSAIAWSNNKNGSYYFDNCRAEIAFADEAMRLAMVSNYFCVKGWFEDTVTKFDFPKPIALLRLDGDWYESTMICLQNLYPKVIRGGYIIVDDYYMWDGCSRAVHDYLHNISSCSRICQTKNGVAYIVKND